MYVNDWYFSHFYHRIDNNEFILLNLEGPLTSKQPSPDDSIGAFVTINMGYKQFMQSIYPLRLNPNLGKESYL